MTHDQEIQAALKVRDEEKAMTETEKAEVDRLTRLLTEKDAELSEARKRIEEMEKWNSECATKAEVALDISEKLLKERDTIRKRVEEALEWLDTSKEKPYWEHYTKGQLVELIEGAREALK